LFTNELCVSDLLLTTKLHTPPTRSNLVTRARLFERLQVGLTGKLTLIAAPAGFGKTTLLSAWRATETGGALPFAWVSLDSMDNDPFQFWTYVIAAIDTLAPGIGATPLALLQSPQPPPIERILTSVLNAFRVLPMGNAVLVLDD
jgi:LuxR family maltose regulon positive regulatory protein